MSRKHQTPQQRQAVAELRTLATGYPDAITALGTPTIEEHGCLVVPITLSMAGIDFNPATFDLNETEDFLIGFLPGFPYSPPLVEVTHDRWLGTPHILPSGRWVDDGTRLCTYLDPDREWTPAIGVQGAIERIWEFIDDAANRRFDASLALHHVFGGIEPFGRDTPTAVVRSDLGLLDKKLAIGSALVRSARRVDIGPRDDNRLRTITISVPSPLYRGLAPELGAVLAQVEAAGGATVTNALAALQRAAQTNRRGRPLFMTLAVSRAAGGAGSGHQLAVGQIDQSGVDAIGRGGAAVNVAPARGVAVQWLRTTDQRGDVAVRRDNSRPVEALRGLIIELWGCGALGSWIAEFLVRAGIARIIVRDPALVGADLLVRQNYTELDVGKTKAQQLVSRLQSIADGVDTHAHPAACQTALADGFPDVDIIIDATVNESVGAALNATAAASPTHPLLASVATDPATATLGLMAIAANGIELGPAGIDEALHDTVISDGRLEPFHVFWRDPLGDEQLVATKGCSSPTFHGSAADAAALAGAMLNVLATHVGSSESGLHLLTMPTAGVGTGPDTYIPLRHR